MIVPIEVAEKVWSVVVEHCDAHEQDSRSFLPCATRGHWTEYRFQGSLGFGGKVWHERGRSFRVSCHPEDSTPALEAAMATANAHLAVAYSEWQDTKVGA